MRRVSVLIRRWCASVRSWRARPVVPIGFAFVAAVLGPASEGVQAQSVPGFEVSVYADVPYPALLAFDPDGTLYTGADTIVSGGSTPVMLNKIGVGGSPVTLFGNQPISDPDACVLDVAGTISGVPRTLLVSGVLGTSNVGRISGIHPDGTVVTLYESGEWWNVAEMAFDHAGRLLFTAVQSRAIWVSTGGVPTKLATIPGSAYPHFITIAPDDTIAVGCSDNKVRLYNPDGSLANGSLATVGKFAGLEYGRGGSFGTDLYALDSVAGTLVRIDPVTGAKTTVGSGFPTGLAIRDLAFGPSGDLFVSVISEDRVLIVSSQWEFLGCALPGSAGYPLLVGSGTLALGSSNSVNLSHARPNALAGLFLAVSSASLPFKGGTLKTFPFFGPIFVPTSPAGTIDIPFVESSGLPSGTPLVVQWAIQDPAALYGVALSNAVMGIAP